MMLNRLELEFLLLCLVKTLLEPDVSPDLLQVLKNLWAQSKHDVGLIRNVEPVVTTPKSGFRPHRQQYPLKPEAVLLNRCCNLV